MKNDDSFRGNLIKVIMYAFCMSTANRDVQRPKHTPPPHATLMCMVCIYCMIQKLCLFFFLYPAKHTLYLYYNKYIKGYKLSQYEFVNICDPPISKGLR